MYLAALAAILSQFPEPIIMAVTDPTSGIPAHRDRAPTINQLREACEKAATPKLDANERTERIRDQLADREKWFHANPKLREIYARYERGEIGEYLRNGGKLPDPGKHIGRFEVPSTSEGNRAMGRRKITDLERRILDRACEAMNTERAGPYRCTPWLRDYLDKAAADYVPYDPHAARPWNDGT
jgi:hypothetical protein